MTEKDIIELIKNDEWMMHVLKIARDLNLPDWMIGAGFVRNKVWNHLSGKEVKIVDTNDVDLVYYDKDGNNEEDDEVFSQKLIQETGVNWEIVNEHHAHVWNNLPPYTSTKDAISQWPETVTAIGVTLHKNDELELFAPYGVDDLVNFLVRPSPNFRGGIEAIKQRVEKKRWLEKWSQIKMSEV